MDRFKIFNDGFKIQMNQFLPTNKISNDICMANNQCMRVIFLFCISPMKVFAKAGFNASSILVKLLHLNKKKQLVEKEKPVECVNDKQNGMFHHSTKL